jgi:hypothetical protein
MKLRLRQLLAALALVAAVVLGVTAAIGLLGGFREMRVHPDRLVTALVASSLVAAAAVAAFYLWRKR